DGLLDVRARLGAAARARSAARHGAAEDRRADRGRRLAGRRARPLARLRRRARRPERQPPPCGGAAVRRIVDRQRPRVDQRHQAQRAPRPRPRVAQARRRDRARHHARDVRPGVARTMTLDPVAVGLKFGFLAVLYLFLLWVARSALKDLRRGTEDDYVGPSADYEDATGMHSASEGLGREGGAPRLRVHTAAGLKAGSAYDLSDGALLGRGE